MLFVFIRHNLINSVVQHSFDIVKQLIEEYLQKGERISGRLVTRVNYFHLIRNDIVPYYHASLQSEIIDDAETFYFKHMAKICQRMNQFNHHGSHLLIKNIQEIHLHINVMS